MSKNDKKSGNVHVEIADITPENFVTTAITTLRNESRSKGLHTVYSGFNEAFRTVFPDHDVIKVVDDLHEEGKIVREYRAGGAMLFLPGDEPKARKGVDAKNRVLDALGVKS